MYPKATSREELQHNFAAIEERIQQACAAAGRPREAVRLLPVSKTVPEEVIRWAYDLGYHQFGENKVQEALAKSQAMADLQAHWAVIGHLQSNKVKYVARFAGEFQALDSLAIAEQLNQRLGDNGRKLPVLVQINSSGEESKYGLAPEQADHFLAQLAPLENLQVRGLMTLALLSENRANVRRCFVLMRELAERLRPNLPDSMHLDELSMGMSGDFEMAIAEGATTVRVGQAIFGARAYPDSYYWPK